MSQPVAWGSARCVCLAVHGLTRSWRPCQPAQQPGAQSPAPESSAAPHLPLRPQAGGSEQPYTCNLVRCIQSRSDQGTRAPGSQRPGAQRRPPGCRGPCARGPASAPRPPRRARPRRAPPAPPRTCAPAARGDQPPLQAPIDCCPAPCKAARAEQPWLAHTGPYSLPFIVSLRQARWAVLLLRLRPLDPDAAAVAPATLAGARPARMRLGAPERRGRARAYAKHELGPNACCGDPARGPSVGQGRPRVGRAPRVGGRRLPRGGAAHRERRADAQVRLQLSDLQHDRHLAHARVLDWLCTVVSAASPCMTCHSCGERAAVLMTRSPRFLVWQGGTG